MDKTSHLNWYEWFLALAIVMLFAALVVHHIINAPKALPKDKVGEFLPLSNPWIEVEVYGAVQHPGRYKLPKGSTLEDLLMMAEPLEEAQIKKKQLKSTLKGGQKIEVSFQSQNAPGNLLPQKLM